MAIVYSQNWSAGNSLFTSVTKYQRSIHGVDSLYPEVWVAENVTVSSGKLIDAGHYGGDHGGTGIIFKGFTGFNGAVGSIEVKYTPSSYVMDSTSTGLWYVPLINMWNAAGHKTMFFALTPITIPGPPAEFGAPFKWDIGVRNFNDASYASFLSGTPTFSAGQEYTFKVCWKCGTPSGGPPFTSVAADGWMRFYLDDVLIWEVTDYPVYIDEANNNHLTSSWVAFASDVAHSGGGLFGALGTITMSDSECVLALPQIKGSFIAGSDGRVTSPLTALFNLDGLDRTDDADAINAQGSVVIGGHFMLIEQASAPTGIANTARIYTEDNGSGKTRLMVKFGTGAAVQIDVEP